MPHQRLLFKLKAHGIGNDVINWIEKWLTHRGQKELWHHGPAAAGQFAAMVLSEPTNHRATTAELDRLMT